MWTTIGIIFVVVWLLLIWEARNAPIVPDDYDRYLDQFDRKEDQEQLKNKK